MWKWAILLSVNGSRLVWPFTKPLQYNYIQINLLYNKFTWENFFETILSARRRPLICQIWRLRGSLSAHAKRPLLELQPKNRIFLMYANRNRFCILFLYTIVIYKITKRPSYFVISEIGNCKKYLSPYKKRYTKYAIPTVLSLDFCWRKLTMKVNPQAAEI